MPQRAQLLLTVVLLATAGFMLYALLFPQPTTTLTAVQRDTKTESHDNGSETDNDLAEMADVIPLSDFTEMTARPLFSPTRRPPPAADQKEATEDPSNDAIVQTVERNQFTVMGIVIAQDEKVALLKKLNQNDEVMRVKEGQTLFGWKVTAITPGSVSLQQNGVTELVKLSDNTLSDAEKQQLLVQARQEQIKAATQQKVINRRSNIINDRRRMIESARRARAIPRAQK